jgi:hypothetical protein
MSSVSISARRLCCESTAGITRSSHSLILIRPSCLPYGRSHEAASESCSRSLGWQNGASAISSCSTVSPSHPLTTAAAAVVRRRLAGGASESILCGKWND